MMKGCEATKTTSSSSLLGVGEDTCTHTLTVNSRKLEGRPVASSSTKRTPASGFLRSSCTSRTTRAAVRGPRKLSEDGFMMLLAVVGRNNTKINKHNNRPRNERANKQMQAVKGKRLTSLSLWLDLLFCASPNLHIFESSHTSRRHVSLMRSCKGVSCDPIQI